MNMRCLMIRLASLALLLTSLPVLPALAQEKSPPNIIVILLDDAGFSDYSFLGATIKTPTIDALAATGITISNFYVQPRCSPTRASLLTGQHPHSVGLGFLTTPATASPEPGPFQGFLEPSSITLAEALKARGYRTYLSGKWHLGEAKQHWPEQHGFDQSFGLISGASSYYELITDQPMVRRMALNGADWTPTYPDFYMTEAITDFAVETVKQHVENQGPNPFFLYLAYTAPHWPLHAPRSVIAEYSDRFDGNPNNAVTQRVAQLRSLGLVPESDDTSISGELASTDPSLMAVYAAQMTEADRGIASLRAALDELALSDNTLIAVFSDNGASAEDVSGRNLHNSDVMPGDKGSYLSYGTSWASVSNTPFRGHKGSTYEGGIRSPLVLYWPDGTTTPPRLDKTSIVSVADLYPTLLSIAGVETPPDSVGEDVSKIFDGETRKRAAPLFWEHLGWRGARDGDWKAVYDPGSKRWQLFNLILDPGEQMNVSSDHPKMTSRLAKAWEQWSEQVGTDGFDMKVWQSYYQAN